MIKNKVIDDFGDEWERFDFLEEKNLLSLQKQFDKYFLCVPRQVIRDKNLIIADFGAGTGRWSHFLHEYASKLYVIEPSTKAFGVASRRFTANQKITLLQNTIENNEVPNASLDLAVCLGVLHHIENTEAALSSIANKIKPGGSLLCYIYYALENKSLLYKIIWRISDFGRELISRLPKWLKFLVCEFIALGIYWPFAKISKVLSIVGIEHENFPLHHYENLSYQVMRNDALDRFGTSIEKRYSQIQIQKMLELCNFEISTLVFSSQEPHWTFWVQKKTS